MDSNRFNKVRNMLVIAVLGVALLGVFLYVYLVREGEGKEIPQKSDFAIMLSTTPEQAPQDEERYTVPGGWRVYQNTRFGFILAHPAEVLVREVDEGKGAMTLVFEDTQNARGFQMFIVPYSEVSISEERFLRDVLSGVRTNVEQVFIDGTEGVAFDSRDSFLGETKEVWFIHKGFLYEVTAPKSLDGWLSEIIATWKFL